MKAVIQRVLSANVTVDGEVISSIGKGLCILIGISRDDTEKDIDYMVRKILNMRLFEDDGGKMWKCSVKEKDYEVLCLSQITLYNRFKGNKPDFHLAMAPELSRLFYGKFLDEMRNSYCEDRVKEGIFGKHIVVGIQNDGPVTINLESPSRDRSLEKEEQTVPNLE